jgi:hypothetical protein
MPPAVSVQQPEIAVPVQQPEERQLFDNFLPPPSQPPRV